MRLMPFQVGNVWMPALIGLVGKAGVGKDTFARVLAAHFKYVQLAFAWPLKLAGLQRFSYDDVFHHKPPAVRAWLQEHGVHMRERNPEYWVDQVGAWRRIGFDFRGEERHVISDVRFPNEAEWVKRNGGLVVRITQGERTLPLDGTEASCHISETALDDYQEDVRVVNGVGVSGTGMLGQLMIALERMQQSIECRKCDEAGELVCVCIGEPTPY